MVFTAISQKPYRKKIFFYFKMSVTFCVYLCVYVSVKSSSVEITMIYTKTGLIQICTLMWIEKNK